MKERTSSHEACARAAILNREAVRRARSTRPHRSYAELSRRIDDAEVVLELIARSEAFTALAQEADDDHEALRSAMEAERLAREAYDEASRRALDLDAADHALAQTVRSRPARFAS